MVVEAYAFPNEEAVVISLQNTLLTSGAVVSPWRGIEFTSWTEEPSRLRNYWRSNPGDGGIGEESEEEIGVGVDKQKCHEGYC